MHTANRRRAALGLTLIALGVAVATAPRVGLPVADWLQRRTQQKATDEWLRDQRVTPVPHQDAPGRMVRPLDPGDEGYLLEIPKLGLRAVVHKLEPEIFSGRNTPTLRRYGIGQVPYTEFLRNVNPGEEGTAAITGHRTTSGAPFRNIHRLGAGDLIMLSQGALKQQWLVVYSASVTPSDVEAIRSHEGVRRLVILACNPPFSARERLIVYATLAEKGGN